mgnify:CR=1 FL=1
MSQRILDHAQAGIEAEHRRRVHGDIPVSARQLVVVPDQLLVLMGEID